MLEYFPDPYPDEVLYSVWARYSEQVAYSAQLDFFQELFGCSNARATVDLPGHLAYFFDHLPYGHQYTLDQLVDDHTLLPFYSAFIAQEKHPELRKHITVGDGRAIHLRVGIIGSHIPTPSWLRYCPECFKLDKDQWGEYYWHRLHQVPGVEVCPIHGTFLENSAIRARDTFTSKGFVSAEQAVQSTVSRSATSSSFFEILMNIARDALYLLEYPCLHASPDFFLKQYRALYAQHGFLTTGEHIRNAELLEAFVKYYSPDVLSQLHCEVVQTRLNATWLSMLARNTKNSQHPLHHILAIRFLGSTVETFFQQSAEVPKPFGEGPWLCLNPACEYYQQKPIFNCQISERTERGRLLGKFACSCGFTYCRLASDNSSTEVYQKGRVVSFGPIWEAELCKLWFDSTISLKQIAQSLGAAVATVNEQAGKLHLPVPRASLRSARFGTSQQRKADKDTVWYRTQWQALMEEYPEVSTAILRRKAPGIHSWLKRHDRAWFDTHRPSPRVSGTIRPKRQQIAQNLGKSLQYQDQSNLDVSISKAVQDAAQVILLQNPLERVTLRRICREVPVLARVRSQPEKAPLTMNVLRDVTETYESFAIRRLRHIAQGYEVARTCPTQKQLIQEAALSSFLHTPLVQQALEEEMKILSAFL